MPTRVMLLVTAILMFVTVWNTDNPDRNHNLTTVTPVLDDSSRTVDRHGPVAIPVPAALVSLPRIVPAERPRESMPKHTPAIETEWSLDEISGFLPDDIAVGEYRIVTGDGRVAAISLTIDDLIDHNLLLGAPARAHYLVEMDGRRWHFIRVSARFQSSRPQTHPAPAIQARSKFADRAEWSAKQSVAENCAGRASS